MKRTFTFIAAASMVAVASAGVANAADAIVPAPTPVAPPVAYTPADTWSGFYAGVFGAYNFGDFDPSAGGASLGNTDADGIAGGAFAGVNFQNGAFVYGAEADFGYSDADGTVPAVPAVAKQGVFGSLRARLGYAFDPFMIYGTAGVAATQAEVTLGANSDDNTHFGWTVGVGAEAMVTDNIFGRLEYRYTDYESKDFNLGGTVVSSGFQENSIRAGIGVQF